MLRFLWPGGEIRKEERVELRTKANLFRHVVPVGDDSMFLQSGMANANVLFVKKKLIEE